MVSVPHLAYGQQVAFPNQGQGQMGQVTGNVAYPPQVSGAPASNNMNLPNMGSNQGLASRPQGYGMPAMGQGTAAHIPMAGQVNTSMANPNQAYQSGYQTGMSAYPQGHPQGMPQHHGPGMPGGQFGQHGQPGPGAVPLPGMANSAVNYPNGHAGVPRPGNPY